MINTEQSLCLFGGISRSLGMVSYRSIKTEVDPVTVVLLHSALSCVVSVPLMGTVSFEIMYFSCKYCYLIRTTVLTQKPVWPSTTEAWGYLGGACVTATIATFSSNAAVKYISPGLASIAQNTDIIGSGSY